MATPLGLGIHERGLEWAVGACGPSPAWTVRGESSLQRQLPPVGAAGEGVFWPTVGQLVLVMLMIFNLL